MAENSHIEWTDHTFNPWIGCTKVSPGCTNCYAETLMDTRYGRVKWGKGNPRVRTKTWKEPLKWNRHAAQFSWRCPSCGVACTDYAYESDPSRFCSNCGKAAMVQNRPRVFCASLADWLDDEVPIEWRVNFLELVHATPHLDWQLLTKRPQNWEKLITDCFQFAMDHGDEDNDRHCRFCDWLGAWVHVHIPPRNVWIGTTVEDEPRADERIPELLKIPAIVRFLSCEPLLEAVDLRDINGALCSWGQVGCIDNVWEGGIHWVICGGESGPHARPMHPAWARSMRDQCQAASVAFFMKQMGGTRKPFAEIPRDLLIRQFPGDSACAGPVESSDPSATEKGCDGQPDGEI